MRRAIVSVWTNVSLLSNLDAKLREDMRQELKTLVRRPGTTTLYVTHDQLEALSMSDTVALERDGQIVQEGSPRDVYLRPSDTFAANFLGRTNLLEGRVVSGGAVETLWGQWVVRPTMPVAPGAAGGAQVPVTLATPGGTPPRVGAPTLAQVPAGTPTR